MERLRALARVFGEWGAPPDAWARVALGLACACALGALLPSRAVGRAVPSRVFVALAAFASACLSLGYVAYYLRGGPRIVDATSYFLQGRALSEGHFAWSVPEPSASFRGRFLLSDGARIAGIFPPGYPLLLSLGFAVGAPMVVGPALAAAITIATFALAREIATHAGASREDADRTARLAAVLSVACAALRYHTADTMSHGACALAFAIAAWAALRATRERESLVGFFLVAGAALGFVACTRFASALALAAWLAWRALRSERRALAIVNLAVGALPGLALLLVAQASVTGHAFASTQSAYYATSDGPAGCFRYGFGAGVGCLFEHGDFVRARLAHGFGALAALGVTARRLAHHLGDVANFEPLAVVALLPAFMGDARSRRVARAALGLVLLQVAAYALFYFDGDYPGGGARFFADALPIEHALVALGVLVRASRLRVRFVRLAFALVALSLAGFAFHASFAHDALRDRDGGGPMFDNEVLAAAHVPSGALVFVDTDHGFGLGHDPAAAESAAREKKWDAAPLVARLRGDDHDRLLFDRVGHPPAFTYEREAPPSHTLGEIVHASPLVATVKPWQPPPGWTNGAETWRFEAENDWPPLAQSGAAWAEPVWATDSCASPSSERRALVVHADGPGEARIALPVPHAGAWRVLPRVLVAEGDESWTLEAGDPPLATWRVDPPRAKGRNAQDADDEGAPSPAGPNAPSDPGTMASRRCIDLPAQIVKATADWLPLTVRVTCTRAPCTAVLDRTLLTADRPR